MKLVVWTKCWFFSSEKRTCVEEEKSEPERSQRPCEHTNVSYVLSENEIANNKFFLLLRKKEGKLFSFLPSSLWCSKSLGAFFFVKGEKEKEMIIFELKEKKVE